MTHDMLDAYARGVLGYIAAPSEEGREGAYQLGRAAIAAGVGVLDIARAHTRALDRHPELSSEAQLAWEYFSEVLASFEMALRGFRDANTELKRFADTLEERVAERTVVLRATEKQLREQRNLLRSVFDSMSDAVVLVSDEGRVQPMNPAAEALVAGTGVGSAPTPSAGRLGLFPPEGSGEGPVARALRGEDVRDEEVVLGDASAPGASRFRLSAAPVREDTARARAAVIVLRDVTARHRAEEAARRAEERLLHAQKLDAIGQLAGGIAHDFNNLLAVVAGYAGLIVAEMDADDPRSADAKEILKAAASAASLTRQLIAFSRQQVLQMTPVELNVVVTDVVTMLRRAIGADVELTTSLDPALGPICADRGQLEQVLVNLAVNARDAMPRGGKLTIETRAVELDAEHTTERGAAPGAYVMLAVTDTGIGMDASTKARIFEPFFTTKAIGRGTGLGLATVHGIVQQSGGHVTVYTEVDRGTSFKVYFPRSETSDAVAGRHAPATESPRGNETILLVEDDEAVRVVAARVLRKAGYHVLPAADASEARAISGSFSGEIHLLVTDIVMPGTPGMDLAVELKRGRPSLRVLLTSGYAPGAMRHQGTLPKDATFLEKPFTTQSLCESVHAALRVAASE